MDKKTKYYYNRRNKIDTKSIDIVRIIYDKEGKPYSITKSGSRFNQAETMRQGFEVVSLSSDEYKTLNSIERIRQKRG